jgi:hypothetical protein
VSNLFSCERVCYIAVTTLILALVTELELNLECEYGTACSLLPQTVE